jgi:dTDP-4-amino-4,6-dideoxygalactose transaminase
MEKKKIWLSLAQMSGHEMTFIQEAFDSNWVAPLGPNVNAFEKTLQEYLFNKETSGNVVALNTGTAALHLGLLQMGVGLGDEVLCQSFTFAATANVIKYLGATPVFIDSEMSTWNMSPVMLREAILWRIAVTGKKPKAILFVNLYGMPARIDDLKAVAEEFSIPLLEDAAESLGSEYKGRKCGTFGDMGVVSFNGNKIITTSGGGALICKDKKTADKTLFYATQARENEPYYQHKEVGYNYRMSNISAGIGRGQMMKLDDFVEARRRNHELYTRLFKNINGITVQQNPDSDYNSNFWLTCIVINENQFGANSEEIRLMLESEDVESRPLWKPMHLQPVFADCPYQGNKVAENLFKNGLCLPSGVALTNEDIRRVVQVILRLYRNNPTITERRERVKQRELNLVYQPVNKVEYGFQPSWFKRLLMNSFSFVNFFHFPF